MTKVKKREALMTVNEQMGFDLGEIAKKQKGSIEQCMNNAAWILADQKIANYSFYPPEF